MRDQTTLSLMELTLMLLLFALAAAVCLQAFALSDRLSRQAEQRDRAVLWAQTMAETWKAANGNMDKVEALYRENEVGDGWSACLDGDWNRTEDAGSAVYAAELREEPGDGLLRRARITVRELAGSRCIYELEAACQETAP